MEPIHNAECFAAHMGLYAMEERQLLAALALVRAGLYPLAAATKASGDASSGFALTGDGIGILPISGQILKGSSKYAHTNSLLARRSLREMAKSPDVKGIMLQVDSPGGTVAGTEEFAADVAAAAQVKPLHAHGSDLMASAAYWVGAQASRVTVNETGEVGSIGVLALVEDTSQQAEMAGIKVHVISTGEFKGMGAPGTEIMPAHLAEIQRRVDAINEHFLAAVKRGRGMRIADVRAAADGRLFSASEAVGMGLIDGVASFDGALKDLRSAVKAADSTPRRDRADVLLRLADSED